MSLSLAALGVQEPRIRKVPAYMSSAGPEVVELCASAGIYLDPWQQSTLVDGLGEDAAGMFTAREVGVCVSRQNGKGEIILARELGGLYLLGEKLILHTAHEYKTAAEGFARIKGVIDNYDHLRKRVRAIRVANGEQGIEMMNGARLRFIARTNSSGRGMTVDCLIVDEAMIFSHQASAALLPTTAARPNAQIWYVGSAGLDDSDVWRGVRARGLAA